MHSVSLSWYRMPKLARKSIPYAGVNFFSRGLARSYIIIIPFSSLSPLPVLTSWEKICDGKLHITNVCANASIAPLYFFNPHIFPGVRE